MNKFKNHLFNCLFKDIKEYKLYALILIIVFFVFIFSFVSYAIFSTELSGQNTISLEVKLEEPKNCFEYHKITEENVTASSYLTSADIGKISITDYFCYEGNLEDYEIIKNINITEIINTEIDVVEIAANALANKGIISIVLPDSLKYIGNNAFIGNSFEDVIIPGNVIFIGNSAFLKSNLSNKSLKIIKNKTGRTFNWGNIINNISGSSFVTGLVNNTIGDVIVTDSDVTFTYDYTYNGNYQEFVVPITGYYQVELWGAEGGNGTGTAGKGGYSKGSIYMEKDEKYYFYIGQQGSGLTNTISFNGTAVINSLNRAGGGATDIRYFASTPTAAQLTWNDIESLRSRIMIAGGGGSNNTGVAGNGGGLKGIDSVGGGSGGTQSAGGAAASGGAGTFGISGAGTGPGGSGYYGGGSGGSTTGGGGGSSFISGYAGVNSVTSISSTTHTALVKHYSGKYFINNQMGIGVNTGNGKAKITYLGTAVADKTNTKLNNVQYIKSCINGSTASTSNYWNEIQAIKNGVNIAKGIVPVGTSTLTNGNFLTNGITKDTTSLSATAGSIQCVTINLGAVYDLDELSIWLYEGRQANENVFSVGPNNTTPSTSTASLATVGGIEIHNFPGTTGYLDTSEGKRYTAWD